MAIEVLWAFDCAGRCLFSLSSLYRDRLSVICPEPTTVTLVFAERPVSMSDYGDEGGYVNPIRKMSQFIC
jgi:hypothetical protein